MTGRVRRWWRRPSENGAVVAALIIAIGGASAGLWSYQHQQDVASWHDCQADAARASSTHDVLLGLIDVAVSGRPPSEVVLRMNAYINAKLPPIDCGEKPGWFFG